MNKDSISKCRMLDPRRVQAADRERILSAFDELKSGDIRKVSEELESRDRLAFEQAVLKSFGIGGLVGQIRRSLMSMQEARAAVREV